MYGHFTCPDNFWHVSDKQIGPISNPGSTFAQYNVKTAAVADRGASGPAIL